jgi:orotate phosphoribosyltransferase
LTLQDELVSCGAIRFGSFTLTSGRTSSYYVDVKQATSRPAVLRTLARALAEHMEGADVVAGVELGAVPLVVAVSLETDVPFAILRKAERAHGTGKGIEGAAVDGRRVVVLEDVTTSGGSVADGVERLRSAGATVDRVVTVVDRNEGSRQRLKEADVEFVSLVSSEDLLRRVKEAQSA